jgi:hypothetical protein
VCRLVELNPVPWHGSSSTAQVSLKDAGSGVFWLYTRPCTTCVPR